MAQKEGEVVVDGALAVVKIGVAYAARLHADECLARPGIGHQYRLQRDLRALGARDDPLNFVDHTGPPFEA